MNDILSKLSVKNGLLGKLRDAENNCEHIPDDNITEDSADLEKEASDFILFQKTQDMKRQSDEARALFEHVSESNIVSSEGDSNHVPSRPDLAHLLASTNGAADSGSSSDEDSSTDGGHDDAINRYRAPVDLGFGDDDDELHADTQIVVSPDYSSSLGFEDDVLKEDSEPVKFHFSGSAVSNSTSLGFDDEFESKVSKAISISRIAPASASLQFEELDQSDSKEFPKLQNSSSLGFDDMGFGDDIAFIPDGKSSDWSVLDQLSSFDRLSSVEIKKMNTVLTNSTAENVLSTELKDAMNSLIGCAEALQQNVEKDSGVEQLLLQLSSIWNEVKLESFNRANPLFLFRDGPATKAVKKGGIILLEDFDLPNQAVTERLNSLLEPDPTFSVTEDITLQNASVPVATTFQLFATVHRVSDVQRLNLSPATRSRFTEIAVSAYDDSVDGTSRSELKILMESHLRENLANEDKHFASQLCDKILLLRGIIYKEHPTEAPRLCGIRQLFRLMNFVCSRVQASNLALLPRLVIGARFFCA